MRVTRLPAATLLALGLLAAPVAAATAPPPTPTPPTPVTAPPGDVLFHFADPRIVESSGLAQDPTSDRVLWTHNDSGDTSRVFAVGPTGRTLEVVNLPGPAVDVEDIAVGPGAGGAPSLYVADIGDNDSRRATVVVRRLPVPAVDPGRTGVEVSVPAVQSETMTYEDSPHDAEALLVHPRTGQLLVVTKDLLGSSVYAAPAGFADGVLRRRGAVPTRLTGTPGGPGIGSVAELLITAGAVSPDGRRIVLRTYTDAYLYEVPGDDLLAALRSAPVVLPLPQTHQGEGVTWTRDGTALLTSSEGKGAPVERVAVPPLPAPSATAAAVRPDKAWRPPLVGDVTLALLATGAIFALRRTARARGRNRAA